MSKKKRKRTSQYFIEPEGTDPAHSNQVLRLFLNYPEVRVTEEIKERDGTPHPAWQCSYEDAEKLLKGRKSTQADFTVWTRPSNHGYVHRARIPVDSGARRAARKALRLYLSPHPQDLTEKTATPLISF